MESKKQTKMKKTLFFVALMALCFVGCDRQPKPGKTETIDTTSVDMVIIKHGQMQFYDHETQKVMPYEAETDSVVNIVFDHNNHLYYTAAHQQDLKLKMIDLSAKDPKPTLCADWKLNLDDITDVMFGTGAVKLEIDDGMENLYMMNNHTNESLTFDYETYHIGSGKSEGMSYEDHRLANISTSFMDHFFEEQGKLYYVTPEGKVCLNDQIDFSAYFEEGDLGDLGFYPMSMSPDGQTIVFDANCEIGEGWGFYCLASSDGKRQSVLADSDNWKMMPQWLDDGSLVYVGSEPRPKTDPEYRDWNTTRGCIKILDPNGETTLLVSDAKLFYLNPVGKPLPSAEDRQAFLGGCDMAIIEDGKVTFYNSATGEYIPLVMEKDEVISGVFNGPDVFYYTVAIGDELYLKQFYIDYYYHSPSMIGDWNLKKSDCKTENGRHVAPMTSYANAPAVGIVYKYDAEFEQFMEKRHYNIADKKIEEGWWPDILNVVDGPDEKQKQFDDDKELFEEVEVPLTEAEMATMGEDDPGYRSYYYYVPAGGQRICMSDKIDFSPYIEFDQPRFELVGISPTRDCVAYGAIMGWYLAGAHGPLCFATLDGKEQMALEGTDVNDKCYGWLDDGSLVYSTEIGIWSVSHDGNIKQLSTATQFTTVR